MAVTDYSYDPTGLASENLITDEIQPVDMAANCAVFPYNHAFFKDGLKVEGKNGEEEYIELQEGLDFTFSPLFLNASAQTTGKTVFTYIVLLTPVDSIRLTYQTLGQYQDEKLLAQITASTFDRSKAYGWAQLEGQVTDYNTQVREESLKDLSLVEILNNKVGLIASALSHPKTNKLNLVLDMTRLEEKLDKKASVDDFNIWVNTPSLEQEVTSVSSITLCTVSEDKNILKGILYYQAADGSDHIAMDLLITNGITASHSETNEQGEANVAITTAKSGTETVVSFTALKDGIVKFKILSEI